MLNPDFRDILSEFDAAGVEYLVVGAFALAAHGHPRATGDIDLYVNPTPDNAKRVMIALARFGAPLDEISADDFAATDNVLQIGLPPRRIDLLTSLEGIASFAEVWEGRLEAMVDDQLRPVLGRADLIKNKSALGRPQDLADVDWLRRNPA